MMWMGFECETPLMLKREKRVNTFFIFLFLFFLFSCGLQGLIKFLNE